jgi:hypothetical protein
MSRQNSAMTGEAAKKGQVIIKQDAITKRRTSHSHRLVRLLRVKSKESSGTTLSTANNDDLTFYCTVRHIVPFILPTVRTIHTPYRPNS